MARFELQQREDCTMLAGGLLRFEKVFWGLHQGAPLPATQIDMAAACISAAHMPFLHHERRATH